MAVRTKQLASGRLATDGALVVVYTVPALETAIVKDLQFMNISASVSVTLLVACDVTGVNQAPIHEEGITARKSLHLERWWVFPPGSELALRMTGAAQVDYLISGTELEGVAD